MGTEKTLTIDRILNVYEGIKSVDNNSKLDFKIAYRLGRLSDKCRSVLQTYERLKDKAKKERDFAIEALKKEMENKSEEEKAEITKQAKSIQSDFTDKLETMLLTEEKIEVPELLLKDFEGKEIPVKFFAMLGELIKD